MRALFHIVIVYQLMSKMIIPDRALIQNMHVRGKYSSELMLREHFGSALPADPPGVRDVAKTPVMAVTVPAVPENNV